MPVISFPGHSMLVGKGKDSTNKLSSSAFPTRLFILSLSFSHCMSILTPFSPTFIPGPFCLSSSSSSTACLLVVPVSAPFTFHYRTEDEVAYRVARPWSSRRLRPALPPAAVWRASPAYPPGWRGVVAGARYPRKGWPGKGWQPEERKVTWESYTDMVKCW